MTNPVHHIELWTHALAEIEASFEWLLPQLGWVARHDRDWPRGRTWVHPSGAYIVLEESSAVTGEGHDRFRPGLNHLALRVGSRDQLDSIREQCASHGWSELFEDRYPHAGGPDHTALFIENDHGFELEIVTA